MTIADQIKADLRKWIETENVGVCGLLMHLEDVADAYAGAATTEREVKWWRKVTRAVNRLVTKLIAA